MQHVLVGLQYEEASTVVTAFQCNEILYCPCLDAPCLGWPEPSSRPPTSARPFSKGSTKRVQWNVFLFTEESIQTISFWRVCILKVLL